MKARALPYRHLSVRVPWHDTNWKGSVCADPLANAACLRLGRIAEQRDDQRELTLASKPSDMSFRRLEAVAVEPALACRVTRRWLDMGSYMLFRVLQGTAEEQGRVHELGGDPHARFVRQ